MPRDLELARLWYQRAANAGVELALEGLASVERLEKTVQGASSASVAASPEPQEQR